MKVDSQSAAGPDFRIMSKTSLAWWEIPFLALIPLTAIVAFKISLVNQYGTVDPYLYTGLARNLDLSWFWLGPTYYAVRFSTVLPMRWSVDLFGDVGGYLVLHYLAYLLLAGSLYAMVRRLSDCSIAVVVVLFLVCNPLAARFLAWDYVNFLAIPYFMASIALWTIGAGRSLLWRFLAGFFAAAAVVAHLYVGIGLAVFYLSVFFAATWLDKKTVFRVMLGAAYATVGFLVCLASGWLGYVAILGWFSPIDLLSPTIAAAGIIPGNAQAYSVPFLNWAASYYYIYVPIILAISAIAGTRGQIRIPRMLPVFLFAIIYAAVIFLYRLLATTFVLEQSVYFSYLDPAIFLMLAVTLESLPTRTVSLALFSVGTVSAALAHVWLPQTMAAFYLRMTGSFVALGVLLCASVIAGGLILLAPRHRGVAPIAAVILAIILQVATFASPAFGVLYGSPSNAIQWPSYLIGTGIANITRQHSHPNERVLVWTPNHPDVAFSTAFVDFCCFLRNPWVGEGMPVLGDFELRKLSDKRVSQILMVSEQPSMLDAGETTLEKAGFQIEERERVTLGYAPVQAYVRLVKLGRRPAN